MGFLNGIFGKLSLEPVDTKIYDEALALFNDEAAQNETAEEVERRSIVNGLCCDTLPDGEGEFGFARTNPVPVNGLFGAWSYLSRLRSLRTGGPVYFQLAERDGSLALFEVISRSGSNAFDLWFSLCHPRRSHNVPEGYILEREAVLPRGITTTADTFPKGLYKEILKEAKRRLHVKVADKESKYIDTEQALAGLETLRAERRHNEKCFCRRSDG